MQPLNILILEASSDATEKIGQLSFQSPLASYRLLEASVEEAASGSPGRVDDFKPHCSLLAWSKNGPGTARALALLAGNKGQPDFPVVILTESDDEVASELIRAGAQDSICIGSCTPAEFHKILQKAMLRHEFSTRRAASKAQPPSLQDVLETTADQFAVLSPDGKLLEANRAALAAAASTAAEVEGTPLWKTAMFHAGSEGAELISQAIPKVAAGESVRFAAPIRSAGEKEIISDISLTPILDGDGNVSRIVFEAHDITEQKRREAELASANTRLLKILNSTTDGFAVFDNNWCYTYFSDKAVQILGKSREEVLGRNVWELFPRAVGTQFYHGYHHAVETGQPVHFEEYYPAPLDCWLECHCYPSEGGLSVYFHDVSARKNVESALRESEERLRGTFENAAIGIAHVGVDGRWLRMNPALCRITGYSPEELELLTFADITHEEDRESDLELAQSVVDGKINTYSMEKRYLRKDGSVVWVNLTVSLLRDVEGNPLHFISMVDDISAKKAALEELNKQRHFVERLMHVMPNVLYVISMEEQRVVWANRILGLALGYTREQLSDFGSRLVDKIMHPDDMAKRPAYFDKLRHSAEGKIFNFEYRLLDAQGEWRWFQSHDTAFSRDKDGNIRELIGTASDITERKLAENALKEGARRKDEFLAMLGHELRNPLGAIRHAVQITKESANDDEAINWAREIMDRQSLQLSRMVDDLLDVARINKGSIELRLEDLDLKTVLHRAVAAVRPLMEAKSHACMVEIDSEPTRVHGDAARLEQVIVNLLSNAAKYTSEGGNIWVGCHAEKGQAIVIIRDNGVGIEPKLLPHVFDLFTQADSSIDRAQGGLGIGLTVVKSLVEMHGGHVFASSDGIGCGATMTLHLPLVAEVPLTDSKVAAMNAPVKITKPPRVLIVDDHADAAQTLGRLLTRRNCEVKIAHDGPGGVAAALEFMPEVLLLDLGLPGFDGYQLATILRQDSRFSKALFVAISGYAQEADRKLSHAAGFDLHCAKPIDFTQLLTAIQAHVL